ncbi:MAG: hypothetical protein MSG77_04915 [Prevotella sp.]|nr:hypothetical protein [Prevotella sp.]
MEKDIRFTGYTAVPSDYECSDGELTQAYNLINEDGAYKSLLAPKVVFNLGESHKVIYVHKATTYTHYIIQDTENKKLLWTNDGKSLTDLYSLNSNVLYQVVGIGNTLIALTDTGMFYFLWKGDTAGYLFLGNDIPELSISFGLQGEMQRTDEFTLEFDNLSWETKTKNSGVSYQSYNEFTDENKKKITSQVLAKVNKFIADRSTNKGKFIYPFLVRYAYRLYDGSLIRHSAPVLMVCSTSCAPIVMWRHLYGNKGLNRADVRVVGMLHSLDYAVINQSELDLLKNWSDIVKSVDIFVSKPIYTYDQNGECDKFFNYDEYGDEAWGYSICKHTNQAADTTKYPVRYQKKDMGYLYQMTFDKDNLDKRPGGILGLPRKDTSTVKEDIRNCSNFYFLESIKLEQLATTRTLINIEEDYLQSLVNREVMTDDYDSHDKIIAKYAFGYNSRINLANIKKTLFEGFNAGAMLTFTDGYVKHWPAGEESTIFDRKETISVYVYIKHAGRDIVVHGTASVFGINNPTLLIYYPNANAYKAIISSLDYVYTFYEVSLERHSFLNGSFYYGGWDYLDKRVYKSPIVSNDTERTIDIPNKIYTSEINNPFFFPVTGINTIGTGKILGISTAAKALSQGQFGQFPLYAFTDEGVWALEVNASGGYSAKQPITRDVCISSDSITQIDSAVLFATDRGIMEISGSQTQCLTDIINGDEYFSLDRLPGLGKLYPDGIPQVDCTFSEYRKNARMAYDYVNQRIIVFNASKDYAYVFSMKSKLWGIVASSLTSATNSYPNAYAMAQVKTIEGEGDDKKEVINNCLVDISHYTETHHKGLLVTRPIKLEVASMLKTFDTVFLRGLFGKGKVQVVLYGSRDNIRWHLIHSAKEHYLRGFRGTPYKYFRIVAITDLSIGETLVGASVAYTPRLTNQIR